MGSWKRPTYRPPAPTRVGALPLVASPAPLMPAPVADDGRGALRREMRGIFRSLVFPINETDQFFEQDIETKGPCAIRVSDIRGLDVFDTFTARLMARSMDSRTESDAVTLQSAYLHNALPSKRAWLFIPRGGQWKIRLDLTGPLLPVTVYGDIYDGVGADGYAGLATDRPADVITGSLVLDAVTTAARLNDCLNVYRITLDHIVSVSPCTYSLGANGPSFNITGSGVRDPALPIIIYPAMQSVIIAGKGEYSYSMELE